jgi:FkbM family methyltransferase
MASLVSRAVTVAREEGFMSLMRKTREYISWRTRKIKKQARYRLWQASGTRTIKIGDARAEFYVNDTADCEAISFFEDNEKKMIRDMLGEISEGDIVWDVGANFGIYTCLLQKVPSVNVVAFEPFPENTRRLKENLELNGLDSEVVEIALSNEDGEMEFGFASGADGSLGGTRIATKSDDAVASVKTRRADGIDLPQPSVVKIDVEGAEYDVIDGMRETLRGCRLVYCEIHQADDGSGSSIRDYGSTPDDVIVMLEKLGFEINIIEERNNQKLVKATK